MFCPRCGRPVSEGANFCGGCGLPRREIERYARQKARQMSTPRVTPRPRIPDVDIDELTGAIERLQGDLSGDKPVDDYNTQTGSLTTASDTPDSAAEETAHDWQPEDIWRHRGVAEEAKEPRPRAKKEEEPAGVYYNSQGTAQSHSDGLFNGGYSAAEPGYTGRQGAPYTRPGSYSEARGAYQNTQSSYSYNAPQHPLYNDTHNIPYTARQRREYQPPVKSRGTDRPLTTVDFLWTILIGSIPFVGIAYMVYLALSKNVNANKRSWARATLIFALFGMLISVVFFIGFFSSVVSMMPR